MTKRKRKSVVGNGSVARRAAQRRAPRENPEGRVWSLYSWGSDMERLLREAQEAGEARAVVRGIAAGVAAALTNYNPTWGEKFPAEMAAVRCDLRMLSTQAATLAAQPDPGGRGPLATEALVESFVEALSSLRSSLAEVPYAPWRLDAFAENAQNAAADRADEYGTRASTKSLMASAGIFGDEDGGGQGEYIGAHAVRLAIANMDMPAFRTKIVRDVAVEVLRAMLRDGRTWLPQEEAERALGSTPDGRSAMQAAEGIVSGVEQAAGASLWSLLTAEASAAAERGDYWPGAWGLARGIASAAIGDNPEEKASFDVPRAALPKRYRRTRTSGEKTTERVRKAADLLSDIFGRGTEHDTYDIAAAIAVAHGLGRDDLSVMLERFEREAGEPVTEYEAEAQATYGRMVHSEDPLAEARGVLGADMPTGAGRRKARSNPSRGPRATGPRRSTRTNGTPRRPRTSPASRGGRRRRGRAGPR